MRSKNYRIVTIFLAVVMMFALSLTVFAGAGNAVTKDGVTAQLVTDKDEYSADDTVNAIVKVENNSGKELKFVTTIKLPSGKDVVSGTKSLETTMPNGERWETPEGFFVKAGDLQFDYGNVETGDLSNMGALVVVNILAVVCLAALFVYGKNKKTWFSMFLCLIMVFGMFAYANVANAAAVSGTIEVSCAVKVDGEEAKVVATVSYADTETPVELPELKAAMCKVDITPKYDVQPQGYDNVTATYPNDFLTDLLARILILEVDGERMVHLNVEINYIGFGTNTSAGFKDALANAAGAKPENLFLSHYNSHQTAPIIDETHEAAIIDAVKAAAENLVPVKVGVDTYGTAYGISRGESFGMSHEYPYDNTVTVIRFDNAETNAPVGMIYCAPIHNTTFGIGDSSNWNKVMCEFSGLTCRYLEEKQAADNAGFTAMYLNGFMGNSAAYFPETDSPCEPNFDRLKEFAGQFGEEIMSCYNDIDCEKTNGIEIKFNQANYTVNKGMTAGHIDRWGSSETANLLLNTYSIGDVAHIEMNVSPYTTIGAHLRAESPFEYLTGASMIDHGYLGYLPLADSNPNDVEANPWRTAFDSTGEKQFLDSALDALCDLKGVTYKRTMTTQTAAAEQDGKRVYTFAFEEEIIPDKLVVSFNQSSRLNCAEDFVLEVYDKAGNKTHTIEMTDNSVNYLGFSVENVKAATVVLTVSSTYGSEQVADIPVAVHAMNYTPVE